MSDKPVVFLSSTMDSLRDLRSAIRQRIEELNYEVSIAEINFAVLPNQSIPEACLRNVEQCDILVLLVDRNYGTPIKGEWLVRSEYLRAKQLNKAVYVMVEHEALRDYHKANKHPNVDPAAAYGIHEEVVKFLKEIEDRGEWILPFDGPVDVAQKLTKQFSANYAALMRAKSYALLTRTQHLLLQMHILYRQREFVPALLLAEEILRIDRDNPEALVTRAVCKIRLHGMNDVKSIKAGILDCERAIAMNPNDYRARYNLANFKLLSPAHEAKEVRRDLRKLFKEFPDYEFYFESDVEFKRMLGLRRNWTRPEQKKVEKASPKETATKTTPKTTKRPTKTQPQSRVPKRKK
jgi:tetratricopeptide (TPR) repeat protein